MLGFAVASALLGAALGAVSPGRLADQIGRLLRDEDRRAAVPDQRDRHRPGAQLWTGWCLFRVVGGIGVGVASVIAPAYIAETSPPRIRGRLGSLQQLAIVTGIFLSLAVDYLLAHLAGGSREEFWLGLEAWRWMFIVMAVPAILYGVLAFTIPESPRYLVAKSGFRRPARCSACCSARRTSSSRSPGSRNRWKPEKPPSWQ